MTMKHIQRVLFSIVVALSSFALLVASLLCSVQLAAVDQELSSMEKQLAVLEENEQILQARVQSSLSLKELERIATQELGMCRLSPGQMIYLDRPSCD